MNSKLDGACHWFSAGCLAATLTMVCAGHTALKPALLSGNALASLAYWSVCSAFAMATVGFSFVGALQAREHLQSVEGRLAAKMNPASQARFNLSIKSQNIGA